jgi:hypothetical protein
VGGGLGSWMAGRWIESEPGKIPALPAVSVAVALVVWTLAWRTIGERFQTADQLPRILMLSLTLSPLALLMGMPFPLGLRALSRTGDRQVALAWAVNGIMTVCGSVGAIALAMVLGFDSVLVISALVYLMSGALAQWVLRPSAE